MTEKTEGHAALVAKIACAYVGNPASPVRVDEIKGLISTIGAAISALGTPQPEAPAEKAKPAVPVGRSVQPDYIICLEDGKKLKMLKRYLRSQYGLTPEEYRRKWGLPGDYPMVAPNYAEQRSSLAKASGLGKTSNRRKR